MSWGQTLFRSLKGGRRSIVSPVPNVEVQGEVAMKLKSSYYKTMWPSINYATILSVHCVHATMASPRFYLGWNQFPCSVFHIFLSTSTGRSWQTSARHLRVLSFNAGGTERHFANFGNALGSNLKNILTSAVTASLSLLVDRSLFLPTAGRAGAAGCEHHSHPRAFAHPSPPSATAPPEPRGEISPP